MGGGGGRAGGQCVAAGQCRTGLKINWDERRCGGHFSVSVFVAVIGGYFALPFFSENAMKFVKLSKSIFPRRLLWLNTCAWMVTTTNVRSLSSVNDVGSLVDAELQDGVL